MKKLFALLMFTVTGSSVFAQVWHKTGAADAALNGDVRFSSATYIGDTIYALAPGNVLTYSTDKGQTWEAGKEVFEGLVGGLVQRGVQLMGVKDRVYARIGHGSSASTCYYYYSTDHGNTWVIDTAGLPYYANTAFNVGLELERLGDDHIVAYNSNGAYLKRIGESSWRYINPNSSYDGDRGIHFTYAGDVWYSLNKVSEDKPDRITRSTDQGASWTNVAVSGLPAGFAPFALVSNHDDKFYLAGTLSGTEGNVIYYSNDGCATWQATNTGDLCNYALARVVMKSELFAVNDHVFVTFSPDTQDSVSRILHSDSPAPDFSYADVSGLSVITNGFFAIAPPILQYFHIGAQLYVVYADDIYTSEPGFSGETPSSVTGFPEVQTRLTLFPNPTSGSVRFDAEGNMRWVLYNLAGAAVQSGYTQEGMNEIVISQSSGVYFLKVGSRTGKIVKAD